MIAYERVTELLTYDPDSGLMVWNKTGRRAGTTRPNTAGYFQVQVDRRIYLLHRLAYLFMTGGMPNQVIDHINRDSTDNRWGNLRHVSQSLNVLNQDAKGISFNKRKQKWEAYIQWDYTKKHLGYFEDEQDAIVARKAAKDLLFKGIKTYDN